MGRRAKAPYVQMNLGDSFLNLSSRGQKAIRQSRLGHFGDQVFDKIPYEDFAVIYSDKGRGPSDLIYLIAAHMIIVQEDITADEFFLRLDSDAAIQYAMHTTSCTKQPVSRRNYFYFLARVEAYEKETGINLFEQCFKKITESNKKAMGLGKPGTEGRIKKRMDSMMVSTSAAHLTRPGIVYQVNQDAVKLYVGLEGDEIPADLLHYLDDSDRNAVIYHNKDNQSEKLTALLKESLMIRDLMKEEEWHEFDQYKNLIRCIDDQYVVDENGNLVPRESRDIKGTSLQSPREPDATARSKNHKTYVGESANFTECYNDEGASQITEADFQPNTHSDSDYFKEYVESQKPADSENAEQQCITDGAYASAENLEKAAEKGILLIPTSLTGKDTNPLYADFKLTEDGREIITCPNGCKPDRQQYSERYIRTDAWFSNECCDKCPFRANCPGKHQKKTTKVTISKKMVIRAELQSSMTNEEYKKFGRERNAVESIPSIFRRKYGIDDMKTFRPSRRRGRFFLICLAYNGQKFQKFLRKHSAGVLCPSWA